MKIVGIIAECNPFHEGHAYLLREVRKRTKADYLFFLMSGDYVQRGLPAITERRVRTKMALLSGADAVFSLPLRVTLSSAEGFALGGVRILNALGADGIAFGSECGEIEVLRDAASFFLTETDAYRNTLKACLKEGDSYPKAREIAAGSYGTLIQSPNNILAIEYLKALKQLSSGMEAITIRRVSSLTEGMQDATDPDRASFGPDASAAPQSASDLRKLLAEDLTLTDVERAIPAEGLVALQRDLTENGFVSPDDYSMLLGARLLAAQDASDLMAYASVTDSLAGSLLSKRLNYASFRNMTDAINTRNRTKGAVQRALLSIALGLKKKPDDLPDPFYTQLLGFRKDSAPLLKEIRLRSSVSVIAKAADARKVLDTAQRAYFQEEMDAFTLYEGVRAINRRNAPQKEVSKEIVLV